MEGIALFVLCPVARRDVCLHADDRLYHRILDKLVLALVRAALIGPAVSEHRFIKIDCTVHIPVVGYRNSVHSQLFQLIEERLRLYQTVKKRVDRVQVKVNKSHYSSRKIRYSP